MSPIAHGFTKLTLLFELSTIPKETTSCLVFVTVVADHPTKTIENGDVYLQKQRISKTLSKVDPFQNRGQGTQRENSR